MSERLLIPDFTEVITHPDGRKEHRTIFDEEKLTTLPLLVSVGAHADDDALYEGADYVMAQSEIALINITLTDGGGRFVDGYTKESLIQKRLEEDNAGIESKGGVMSINLGFPDGNLKNNFRPAITALKNVTKEFQLDPELVFTLFHRDNHWDHATASFVTTTVFGDRPVYQGDTVNREDRYGRPIIPTHYVPLTEEEKRIRDLAYFKSESQTTNLPPDEATDVEKVVNGPMARGKELEEINEKYPYAAALTIVDFSSGDFLKKHLGERVIVNNNYNLH